MESFPDNFTASRLMAKDQDLLMKHMRSCIYDMIMKGMSAGHGSSFQMSSTGFNAGLLTPQNATMLLCELLDRGFWLFYFDCHKNRVALMRDGVAEALKTASIFYIDLWMFFK